MPAWVAGQTCAFHARLQGLRLGMVRLPYLSYGANVLEPIGVAPQPDAGANSVARVASAVNLVMAAYTGCANVTTTLDPGTIRSASTVQEAWIQAPGSASLHVSELCAVSTSRL